MPTFANDRTLLRHLLLAARIASGLVAILALMLAGQFYEPGSSSLVPLTEATAIIVLGAGCFGMLLWGMSVLVDMERINRYRAARDEELSLLLAEVRTALKGAIGGSASGGSSAVGQGSDAAPTLMPSAVFRSSLMSFPATQPDGALTALLPAMDKDSKDSRVAE